MSRAAALSASLTVAFLLSACSEDAPEEVAIDVVYVPVQQRDVTLYTNYVGRTEASERVEVNARVDGFLEEIAFIDGSTVAERSVLYRIDARPYQANVDRAQAVLAYIDVLDAQRSLFEAQIGVSEAREAQLNALVGLYKAVGGGWDPAELAAVAEQGSPR